MKRLTPAGLSLVMFLVVGGLVAAYIGKNLLARDEPPAAVQIRTIPMALTDIQPGEYVTEAHVGAGRIPADQLEPDMLLNDRVVLNRIAKTVIKSGSPFRPEMLFPPGYKPPLDVADGMRAVTITVADGSSLVDGLINAGQFVDVHLTVDDAGGDRRMGGGLTMTLFKGVQLLAVNGGGPMSRSTNSATLELTPAQANVVIMARDKGKITLSLNPDGKGSGVVELSDADRATLDEILGLKPLPKPEPPFRSEQWEGKSRVTYEWHDGRRTELFYGDQHGEFEEFAPERNTGRGDAGRRDADQGPSA